MKITRFEDIASWQKARELTKLIYEVSDAGKFQLDFQLKNQMRSASTSIMSNIAEGFSRGGDKEFRQFLSQARGSAGEVRAQAHVAQLAGYVTEAQFSQIESLTLDCERLIGGFMRYLGTPPYNGSKYKPKAQTAK